MKIAGYSGLSKDAVYLLSRAEFEKQKVITTGYAVKVLGSYRKATSMLDNLSKRNRLIQLKRGQYIIYILITCRVKSLNKRIIKIFGLDF